MARAIIANIIIAAFFALFIVANLKAFDQSGNLGYVLVALNESVYVFLYLIRRPAVATSPAVLDWGIGFAGTFIGTLLRPAEALSLPLGTALVVIGTLVNTVAVVFLGRSLATVAAERTIKTNGLYRFVRHPLYASEIVVIAGYWLGNASLFNTLIVISNVALLLLRIHREELFLCRNETYRAYVAKTPWRLIPYVY